VSATKRATDGMRLWNVQSGGLLHTFPTVDDQDVVSGVALSPEGVFLAAATHRHSLVLWDIAARQRIGAVETLAPAGGISVAFPHDGSFILCAQGRRYSRFDTALVLKMHHDNLQSGPIFSPSLASGGRFVASIHEPGQPNIIVYDLLNDRPSLKTDPNGSFNAVAMGPDDGVMLAGDIHGRLETLNAETGESIRKFDPPGHSRTVTSVAFSPDGSLALSGSEDFSAKLWDVHTGKEIQALNHGGGFVTCVAFLPNGKFALTGGNDGKVKLWELVP
jgi:WD40 repeat protein